MQPWGMQPWGMQPWERPLADASQPVADPVAGLVDIPPPPAVSLWPQTMTSRITIAIALVALIAWICWFVRHRRMNRYRREALAELDRIAATSAPPGERAASLALLVRRTALAAFPRAQVAALTGASWLSFLDRSYEGTAFSDGPGRDLEAAVYRPIPDGENLAPRIDLVRRWIEAHHA
jgi:hypothetical protein